MALYRQEDRDGLVATLKGCQDKYMSHANSHDVGLRTEFRMKRLMGHVDEAQAALDKHIELHGPNGKGPEEPEFGIFAHFNNETHQIFVDGRPLTVADIADKFNITEAIRK